MFGFPFQNIQSADDMKEVVNIAKDESQDCKTEDMGNDENGIRYTNPFVKILNFFF